MSNFSKTNHGDLPANMAYTFNINCKIPYELQYIINPLQSKLECVKNSQ